MAVTARGPLSSGSLCPQSLLHTASVGPAAASSPPDHVSLGCVLSLELDLTSHCSVQDAVQAGSWIIGSGMSTRTVSPNDTFLKMCSGH